MANSVIETAPGVGKFHYEVIRGEKTDPEKIQKYGKFFYTFKVFYHYDSPKYGRQKRYDVFGIDRALDEWKATGDMAIAAIKRLSSNTATSSAVTSAASAVNAASTDECPV